LSWASAAPPPRTARLAAPAANISRRSMVFLLSEEMTRLFRQRGSHRNEQKSPKLSPLLFLNECWS
jgi:hypothetical protein